MTFLFASGSSAVATRPASPAPMTMTSASTAPSVVGSLRAVASHIPPRSRVQLAMRAPLTDRSLAHGARALGRVDSDLAGVLTRHGTPPLWGREPGFATLVQIVLEIGKHTSELQSPCNLVCRLLLEKKNKPQTHPIIKQTHLKNNMTGNHVT